MTFVEKNIFGQQSHLYLLKNESNIKFLLIPMWHIAQKNFYYNITRELEKSDYIFYEGISSNKFYNRAPSYKKIAKDNGLISQNEGINVLSFEDKIINADMSSVEWNNEISKLSILMRLIFFFLSPLTYLIQSLTLSKSYLLNSKSITSDDYGIDENHEFNNLVIRKRDLRIISQLSNFYESRKHQDKTLIVSIVYGAKHCPSIFSFLSKKLKFNIENVKRYSIIDND